jgi:hypothetical protein
MDITWDEMTPAQKDMMKDYYIYCMANKEGISEKEAKDKYPTDNYHMSSHKYRLEDDGDISMPNI